MLHTSLTATSCPSHPSFSPETEEGRKPKSTLAFSSRGAWGGRVVVVGAQAPEWEETHTWVYCAHGASAWDDTGTPQGNESGGHLYSAGHRYSLRPHGAICNFPFRFGCSRPAWRLSEPRLTCRFFRREAEP